MKVVSSLTEAAGVLAGRSCVLSIGNFDGLHLGHQRIIRTVVQRARQLELPAVILTFEPHPIQLLAPDKAPKRISTPEQKIRQIESLGVDLLFEVRFDLDFAAILPDEFVRSYLVEGLHVRCLCVGANFNFGHRQSGTVSTLRQWARDFELVEIAPVLFRDLPASSTRVREFILNGDVSRAARFLGRWFEIEGRIVSGAGRGRKLTVPTLNLSPANELLPKNGVYVSRISLDGGNFLDAVTNIGIRPTFNESGLTIETFVLQSPGELDVHSASLQFLHRIRDEKRFESPRELGAQIQRDVRAASRFFQLMERCGHARAHTH